MKIVKRETNEVVNFYLVEVVFMRACEMASIKEPGYYLSVTPVDLFEGFDENNLSLKDVEYVDDEYEAVILLVGSPAPDLEAKAKADEMVNDEVIDVLIDKLEEQIDADEREIEELNKRFPNTMNWYGNMNDRLNDNNDKLFGNKKDDITKCKYYVQPSNVTFDQIAGMSEVKEEVLEAIDLFKDADKYKEMGVKKRLNNIMLSGASGCGKTLIVKAISNELDLPLFSCSGDQSDKYVGTTSRNIETLFNDAKKYAPAIVFIDEFEAMAKTRTGESNNSEREGGVSTLLACLDGLGTSDEIMVIVATNLPDAIDPAVRRRFPTKISIANPDYATRLGILKINAKDMKMDDDCDLEKIARNLAGFNGGDIAQIMQSAGILAVRRKKDKVTQQELEDSLDRVIAGLKSKTKKLNEDERAIVSHHEVAHSIATYFLKDEVIQKISIIPRTGSTLGYVLYANENENDKFLSTKEDLLNSIVVSLAGRAGEEIIFGKITGGCSNDLEKATDTAETLVTRLGMSDAFGLMSIDAKDPLMRPKVLEEVHDILNECYGKAKTLLLEHETLLREMAKVLIEKEEMTLRDFEEVLHKVEN